MTIFVGDITTLKVDGIVCSTNYEMLGSFNPEDDTVNTQIVLSGGLQIRQELKFIASRQNSNEPSSLARITKGYNLPANYVIFTYSPEVVYNRVGYREKEGLVNCYKACLDLALSKKLKSVAFCCISTGDKNYPKQLAAEIAVSTVSSWLEANNYPFKVVFCLYDESSIKYYETNFIDYDVR